MNAESWLGVAEGTAAILGASNVFINGDALQFTVKGRGGRCVVRMRRDGWTCTYADYAAFSVEFSTAFNNVEGCDPVDAVHACYAAVVQVMEEKPILSSLDFCVRLEVHMKEKAINHSQWPPKGSYHETNKRI